LYDICAPLSAEPLCADAWVAGKSPAPSAKFNAISIAIVVVFAENILKNCFSWIVYKMAR
jgi:hypothetical protein